MGFQLFEFFAFFGFDAFDFGLFFRLNAVEFLLRNPHRLFPAFRGEALGFLFRYLVAFCVYVNLLFDEHDFLFFAVDDFRLVRVVLFGVGAQVVRVERCGRGVEIELTGGHELVENCTGVFVLRTLFFEETSAFRSEGIVAASSAAGIVGVAVVGGNQPLFFEPFELIVQSGLFELVLSFALCFNLFEDVVTVTVPVPERTENYGGHVPADEVAVDG